MDENRLRFGVGVLVISAIGVGVILTFLFGAFPSALRQDYTLSVDFPSAKGVGVNTKVVRDGVQIGRVSKIDLLKEGGVRVTLAMQQQYRDKLTHSFLPTVGGGNLISGDAQIEFVKATDLELQDLFRDNMELIDQPYGELDEYINYGRVTPNLLDMQDNVVRTLSSIQQAGDAIRAAGTSVNNLALQIDDRVGDADGDLKRLSDEAVEALEEFQGVMRDVRVIIGDEQLKQNLNLTLERLPELLAKAEDTFGTAQEALDAAQETFETFDDVGVQFEKVGVAAEQTVSGFQGTVDNLEEITEPLAENSDKIVAQVLTSLDRLDRTLVQVEAFGKMLNESDGSLRRFLEDDEIYWEIRRTVQNIEQATARVRPILDDVRIFTDKAARDPRQFGVRGALSRRPSGAGIK